jgi:hypothetical protein
MTKPIERSMSDVYCAFDGNRHIWEIKRIGHEYVHCIRCMRCLGLDRMFAAFLAWSGAERAA